MTDPPEEPLPDLDTLMGMIERSRYHAEVADPPRRRRRVFEALAGSDDPMWREIGQQLRDGQIRPRDVLRVDAYRDHIDQGLAQRRQEFRDAVAEASARDRDR